MSDLSGHELDVHAALAALREEIVPITQHEVVHLGGATGRVLASDVVSTLDLPAFDNAGMDGYAVRATDCSGSTRLRVAGSALAGHPWEGAVQQGIAVRITTGAPMPSGADAVVIQEDALREGDMVSFSATVGAGLNVRARGEHIRAGEVVLRAGATLNATEVGLAAAIGSTQLHVFRRLRVGLASTGDELADPPASLSGAGSYDGNRPLLAIACRAAGFGVVDLGIGRDEAADFVRLIDHAHAEELDALLVSGGSALGDADIVRKADAVRFLPVNIRPGRGVTFGNFDQGSTRLVLLGLPGNAVAAFVMFQLIALPALRHFAGGIGCVPDHLPLPLAADLICQPGRVDYRRGRFQYNAAGEVAVQPLNQQGSAMLRTLVDADVLIAAGPKPRYRAGESILVVPLAALPR
jgi:molybdopterin molybdotransferase